MLTLIDVLLSEYPWPSWTDRQGRLRGPEDWIVWRLPLAKAFALYAAISPRYGVEGHGPSYIEQEMMAAADRVARKWEKQKGSAD